MTLNDTTNAVAGAAIVSPWWLTTFNSISELSVIILPILGVVWLLTQIVTKIISTYREGQHGQ